MSDQFNALLRNFAQSKGMLVDDIGQAIEFVADDMSVVVLAHPWMSGHLLIEVHVADLGADAGSLSSGDLLLLHQLNESSRFEHDWVITIGVDGSVQIHCARPISQTDASSLEALMGDGLERGDSLRELIASLGQGTPGATSGQGAPEPAIGGPPPHMLRA